VFRHTFLVTQVTACCASAAHISNSKQGCEETMFATHSYQEVLSERVGSRCERVVCALGNYRLPARLSLDWAHVSGVSLLREPTLSQEACRRVGPNPAAR
jgi:hypothetical protein